MYGAFFVVLLSILFISGKMPSEIQTLLFSTKLNKFLRYLLPVSAGWWFVFAYVILLLLSKTLNEIILNINKKGHLVLVIICWISYSLGSVANSIAYCVIKAVFFYIVGALWRIRNKPLHKLSSLFGLLVGWGVFIGLQYIHILLYNSQNKKDIVLILSCTIIKTGIAVVIAAICLFNLFISIHIKPNNTINTVSNYMFGVYLIHDNDFSRTILWASLFKVQRIQFQSTLFPLMMVGTVLTVFLLCIIIEMIRKEFFEPSVTQQLEKFLKTLQ